MLEGIWIENFKSYKTGQLLPLAPITLMIGANASGKSNAIEAFRFLSWFTGGEKLSTIQNRINDSEKIFRGDVRDLFCSGGQGFCLGANFSEKWNEYRVSIQKQAQSHEIYVHDETLRSNKNEQFLFETKKKLLEDFENLNDENDKTEVFTPSTVIHYKNLKQEIESYSFLQEQLSSNLNDVKNLLTGNLYFESFIDNSFIKETHLQLSNIVHHLNQTYFFDLIPSQMRQESLVDQQLRQNGQNLSGVLYALWSEENQQANILQFIKSLPEQDFKSLKFYKDHRDRVELALIENFADNEQEWGIELLSDGTLRVLGIAAAILSAPEGSTLAIEEIDNGIHPSRARYLLDTMLYFAQKRQLRLLLTTHNPALMDALPDQALADVVFAYRDPKMGDSRLIRLSDLDDYVGLVAQGPLGELVTQGVVDRFVKHPISNLEQKQNALAWLDQISGVSHE
ncbi:putative ATPase [Acinetobacter calcoaceticus]|uniref:Putative ATPase n=1 Tax=Acinetobacter calcoaceticus TaxID=471 RepID=A0A4R1XWI0_ACICA|nr:putative ATPase [Acinetobacter calcoaceticus]